jgi:hypothetical protein
MIAARERAARGFVAPALIASVVFFAVPVISSLFLMRKSVVLVNTWACSSPSRTGHWCWPPAFRCAGSTA